MPRGGYRPGSGPKKGTKYKQVKMVEGETLAPLPENPILPLDYMLRVLNDPRVRGDRKDRVAAIAAPYFHAKAGEKGGKKEARQEAARSAAAGRFASGVAPKLVSMKKQG